MDLTSLLERLARRRPLFHSEADLQHELAWELRASGDVEQVRVERPFEHAGTRPNLDLVLRHHGRSVGVELKYWTRRFEHEIEGETYRLKDQAAQDVSRYDFWKDVARLERLVDAGALGRGFAIAITNDSGYWSAGRPGTVDAAFRLDQGRGIAGRLAWGSSAGVGTMRRREKAIDLLGHYTTSWLPYSSVGAMEFRWMAAAIGEGRT